MPSLSEETGGRVSMLMPGSTIGIIGGGQLGRMMALSARYMGFRVGVLDPTPNCPTGQVADFQITAEYDDKTAIHDLAVQSDVLTYEFENVDAGAIDEVRGITATPQGTDLLRVTQHRVREKQFINDHGTATAPWRAVNNFDELDAALGDIHYPAVLKTVSGGYDGHGQLVLRSDYSPDDLYSPVYATVRAMAFDGKRLAIVNNDETVLANDDNRTKSYLAGTTEALITLDGAYFDNCGFTLTVFDQTGVAYSGAYVSSLESVNYLTGGTLNMDHLVLPYSITLSWQNGAT